MVRVVTYTQVIQVRIRLTTQMKIKQKGDWLGSLPLALEQNDMGSNPADVSAHELKEWLEKHKWEWLG